MLFPCRSPLASTRASSAIRSRSMRKSESLIVAPHDRFLDVIHLVYGFVKTTGLNARCGVDRRADKSLTLNSPVSLSTFNAGFFSNIDSDAAGGQELLGSVALPFRNSPIIWCILIQHYQSVEFFDNIVTVRSDKDTYTEVDQARKEARNPTLILRMEVEFGLVDHQQVPWFGGVAQVETDVQQGTYGAGAFYHEESTPHSKRFKVQRVVVAHYVVAADNISEVIEYPMMVIA